MTGVHVLPKSVVREDVGREVAVAMRVERDERRAARRRGRDDVADERAVLHALDRAAQLGPRVAPPSVVSCTLPVVGADPENLRVERRLGEVRDLADVVAVVARELDVPVQDAHHLERVAVDRAREVLGARPRRAVVLRDEEAIAAEIHGARRVARRHDGRVPVVAVGRLAGRRTRVDAHRVAGQRIHEREASAARRRVDLAPVGLVDGLAGAVAEADLHPVLIQDAEPVARRARPHPRVVVLEARRKSSRDRDCPRRCDRPARRGCCSRGCRSSPCRSSRAARRRRRRRCGSSSRGRRGSRDGRSSGRRRRWATSAPPRTSRRRPRS